MRYWLVDYQACGGAPLLTVLAAGALPHWEQMVTAMPEVRRMMLKQGDEFLLLACDGIWDVCTNQEVRAGSRGGSGLQPSPAMPVLAASRPDAAEVLRAMGASMAWHLGRHWWARVAANHGDAVGTNCAGG